MLYAVNLQLHLNDKGIWANHYSSFSKSVLDFHQSSHITLEMRHNRFLDSMSGQFYYLAVRMCNIGSVCFLHSCALNVNELINIVKTES